jgi:hypothetical protein
MLKGKTVTFVDVDEFDALVMKTYGKTYSFQQQDGCKERGTFDFKVPMQYRPDGYENDTIPEVINGDEMGVSFKAWLARDPKEWNGDPEDESYLRLFWTRNFYPHVDEVINDLYNKGLIAKGEYVINIDW